MDISTGEKDIRLSAAELAGCALAHSYSQRCAVLIRSAVDQWPRLGRGLPLDIPRHDMRSAISAAAAILFCALLPAAPGVAGDRLQWTGAVTQVEGSAGGGLVPWALIGGLETDAEVGATGFVTYDSTGDFSLRAGGASIDVDDRVEVSFARQRFDAGSVAPGLTLGQDVVGLKVRLIGDAVFAPDQWLPQISAGAQGKRTLDFDQIPRAVGAAHGEDVDLYGANG